MEAATSDAQHTEMLERINQLNILRESNATLRTDCEAYSKRSRELEVKLTALSAELDPAKEEARTAKAELVARDVQIKRLEDESRHWQERNTQLLSTYDRVDPADIQNLKGEVETLKSEKAELEKAMAEREEKSTTHEKRISLLEENIRRYRDTLGKANEMTKRLREEKAQLSGTITELQTKVDALSANQATADASKDLSDQLTSLRQEKEAVEKALADEKAARAAQPSSTPSPEQTAALAALREERDRLLSEKEAWTKASTDRLSSDNDTNSQWETEKAELVKARDEALAQTKFVEDEVKKSAENLRSLRQSNEKFQARVSEFQKARERASAEQAAAVAAAVEKVKSEMQATDSSVGASEELVKKHAAELETLRAHLTAQHETSLKEAVESAVAAAKAEAASITDADDKIKAAVDAAIAAHDPRKAEEVAAAVDSGRRESLAKLKIKDGQLFRLQARLKQLETQIDEWCQAGLVPDILSVSTGPAAPGAPIASTSKPIANGTPAVAPSPTTSAPITSTPVASTPAKPATSAPAVAPSTAPSAGVRKTPVSGAVPLGHPEGAGRGRGAPRGGVRGVARGLSIRGAAPGRGGAPSPTTAPAATAGVSIMGAATKRPRDEEAASSDDSLVKRMKPASEATAAATSKPVTLRRPPPPS
ncbi:hypothetical protein BJ138DRAFT_435144 [Hygrophoropsis aurantiaca]|uniref:Uncharacterized protein n=1 Tax=Hygrophoropsis aurantiaca TaxID=72124 RepID=A0ACB8ALL6_9AGAM|nr:hypothetical protein BJ138DRAFT_435144 [Hygrophoropsis aurantiaca]